MNPETSCAFSTTAWSRPLISRSGEPSDPESLDPTLDLLARFAHVACDLAHVAVRFGETADEIVAQRRVVVVELRGCRADEGLGKVGGANGAVGQDCGDVD